MSTSSKIWLSLAHMSGKEQQFIQEAFDTNWVVPLGPNVDGFEKDLTEYLGENKHIVALSAGTAAIHLGLLQLGVGPGDYVICQSFTFSATANPIKYLGAEPVFVDSERDTWNISPTLLERAIKDIIEITGKKPKAIMPVHLYGMPARMDKIMNIASKYGIPVLEDAAEALGSKYKGKYCGTYGDFACLSFNGNKMITTSGGGALVCKTAEAAAKTKFYATQARDNAPHYQHSEIGYNYRMSNICAGIGRGQMFVLDEHIRRRRENNALYRKLLKDLPGISILDNPSDDFESNHWLTCILVDSEKFGFTREDLRLKMEAENIETRPLWKPMHLQPVFAGTPFYTYDEADESYSKYSKVDENGVQLGVCGELFEKGLCLPSGPLVTAEDVQKIVDVFSHMNKR
ncbi:Putative pyridoxal phosphate-dependent aminotransferase epsN [Bacteroidales bacterium CF]|jgi:Predicted pyridoxal phosphate-dependent enzyme apparently involved in regulation of cell wall biogenesis|nr:Putative pyridoxal phosphate-dependent aminotransferase epsN [Bacteroidales bacterium CF]